MENRAHVTGALELKEAGVGSQRQGAVEELASLFTGGARGDDRAEESGAVNGNQRNTDVGATHGLQGEVQGGAHLLVVLIGEGHIRQLCGQVDLLQRLDDCVAVGISLVLVVVNLLAQSVVEGLDDLVAVQLTHSGNEAGRRPGPVHRCLVVSGQVAALVVHGQGEGTPGHLNIADLLHLANPAGGNPAPGANRIEPEINLCGGVLSHGCSSLVRMRVPPVQPGTLCSPLISALAKPAVSERGTC